MLEVHGKRWFWRMGERLESATAAAAAAVKPPHMPLATWVGRGAAAQW